ncbi:permease-like cell division protein FtsX [Streptomyces sp. NPDC090442]|uniref:permease-like cell division protein FtsX n=1 Tax=Streptomyces sp. NPDC090442 TaxID=3365962 RepID=UPI003816BE62
MAAVLSALIVVVAVAIWAPWSEGRTPAAARPAPTAETGRSAKTVVVLVTQTATPEQTDALRTDLQATRGVLSVEFVSPQQWASCARYLPPASRSQQPGACLVARVSNDVSTAALSRAVSRRPGVQQVTD